MKKEELKGFHDACDAVESHVAGLKIIDKRGVDPEERSPFHQQKEARIAEESTKPKVIPMRRCPVCKGNTQDMNYLFHPQLMFYICLECGGVHMDKKLAKKTFDASLAKHMVKGNARPS